MESSCWGCFTLVAYVPEPLGSVLDGIRQAIPCREQAPAHITILPPRVLDAPLEAASAHAAKVLAGFSAFEIELATLCCFPKSKIHYLGLTEGSDVLYRLHSALNTGALSGVEQYEFLPHLTLGGPLSTSSSEEAEADRIWERLALPKRFQVNKIVALWAKPHDQRYGMWERVANFYLGTQTQQKSEAASGRTF